LLNVFYIYLATKPLFVFFLDGIITQYPVTKIPVNDIVDSNGAGDAFIGGKFTFYI